MLGGGDAATFVIANRMQPDVLGARLAPGPSGRSDPRVRKLLGGATPSLRRCAAPLAFMDLAIGASSQLGAPEGSADFHHSTGPSWVSIGGDIEAVSGVAP
jgi:hypothetical protein